MLILWLLYSDGMWRLSSHLMFTSSSSFKIPFRGWEWIWTMYFQLGKDDGCFLWFPPISRVSCKATMTPSLPTARLAVGSHSPCRELRILPHRKESFPGHLNISFRVYRWVWKRSCGYVFAKKTLVSYPKKCVLMAWSVNGDRFGVHCFSSLSWGLSIVRWTTPSSQKMLWTWGVEGAKVLCSGCVEWFHLEWIARGGWMRCWRVEGTQIWEGLPALPVLCNVLKMPNSCWEPPTWRSTMRTYETF